jgi:hypothetical protein
MDDDTPAAYVDDDVDAYMYNDVATYVYDDVASYMYDDVAAYDVSTHMDDDMAVIAHLINGTILELDH